jgi:formamidopyrimidine-DNA glycosylase
MPELPEVETTRRGIEPHLAGRRIREVRIREPRLRWPVDPTLAASIEGRTVTGLGRRGKYLLVRFGEPALLIHLGMSGSLRYLDSAAPPGRHDHLDLVVTGGGCIRYNDPRRFGSFHYSDKPDRHPLLRAIGPEPLGDDFTAEYLTAATRGRKAPIKNLIMNAGIVAGVGNIYANEALYIAGVHPLRAAGRISAVRLERLVDSIRSVLAAAIESGGTTLRDFVGSDGRPGYFRQSLAVYERDEEPCRRCEVPIRRIVLGQRATYYCPRCQR